jgi:hypothetical protein
MVDWPLAQLVELDFGEQGEALMTKDYKNWPTNFPLFVVHGTGDKMSERESFLGYLSDRLPPPGHRA